MDSSRRHGWVEAAINRLLALDPDAVRGLSRLNGKVIRVRVVDADLSHAVSIQGGRVESVRTRDQAPDVTISGPLMTLVRLLIRGRVDAVVGDGRFEVTGDLSVLEQLLELHQRLDLDWEELLSRILGDVAAHQIGNLVRDTGAWARATGRHAMADIGEFLSEESRLIAAPAELEAFAAEVSALHREVDELSRRIERLARAAAEREA